MPQFNKILDCLQSDPRGRTVLCNMVDGLRSRQYDTVFSKRVLRTWQRYHTARAKFERLGPQTWIFRELWKSLQQYHGALPNPVWWTGPSCSNLEMKCRRRPKPSTSGRYGASRSSQEIFEALSDASHRTLSGRFLIAGSSGNFLNNDDILDEMRISPESERQFAVKSSAGIPEFSRLLWFTRASDLIDASRNAEPANAVRDRLGLVHYRSDFSATAVLFGDAELRLAKRTARPTFADAGAHRRFKMRAGQAKNRRRLAWGYTADLDKIASSTADCDGVMERITLRFDGTVFANNVFVLLPLGKTSGTRGDDSSYNDDIFLNLLLRDRTMANLRSSLRRRGIH